MRARRPDLQIGNLETGELSPRGRALPPYIDPTKEQFKEFRERTRADPIHMLNLVCLRERAAYPDGRAASGAEAYAAYGRESLPVFERLGGAIVWRGRVELVLIG